MIIWAVGYETYDPVRDEMGIDPIAIFLNKDNAYAYLNKVNAQTFAQEDEAIVEHFVVMDGDEKSE